MLICREGDPSDKVHVLDSLVDIDLTILISMQRLRSVIIQESSLQLTLTTMVASVPRQTRAAEASVS